MSGFVYDAAVLVAADRNERRSWAEHKARLELGIVPIVPAPGVAQVSRSPKQAPFFGWLLGGASQRGGGARRRAFVGDD